MVKEYLLTVETLQQKLFSFKRVPYLEKGSPDLWSMLNEFTAHLEANGSRQTHILDVEGTPGAGKSYLTEEKILPALKELISRIPAAQKALFEDGPGIHVFRWDEVEDEGLSLIEQIQKSHRKGQAYPPAFTESVETIVRLIYKRMKAEDREIFFKEEAERLLSQEVVHGKPYPLGFLLFTGILLKKKVADVVKSYTPYSVAIIDKPGGTAIPISDMAILKENLSKEGFSRDYAASLLRDLWFGSGVFQNIREERIYSGYIGVVPGPRMHLLAIARHLIQEAKNFETANKITSAFGLPAFSSPENWRSFPTGGSLDQVITGRLSTMSLLHTPDYDIHKLDIPPSIPFALDLIMKSQYGKLETEKRLEEENRLLDYLQANVDPFVAESISEARNVAEIEGKDSPTVHVVQALHMLASAKVLESIAEEGEADQMAILYNNPILKFPDRRTLNELLAA